MAADGTDRIPYIAKEFGMKVSLGIWAGRRPGKTTMPRATLVAIEVIKDNPTVVDRVFVGNEAIDVRFELTPEQVAGYIRQVKQAINNKKIEVGTAENWNFWEEDRAKDLAKDSDFIGVHVLPYWNGVSSDQALNFLADHYGKKIQRNIPTSTLSSVKRAGRRSRAA